MHTLLNLVLVFFARHWLVAITNAALTALLGLGLMRWARKWRPLGLSTLQFLRLRRFVLLAALYKGALFLLLGVNLRGIWHQPLIYGIQIPDPRDLLCLVPASSESIWQPAAATKEISLLLLGISFGFLGARAVQLARSRQALRTILRLQSDIPPLRINALLQRAAAALTLPDGYRLPAVVLAEVEYPTPMLVGVRHPYILLSPALASVLSDVELEMAFRHELSHFRHRDHWWRWLFTWLEDVGRLNLLSSHLGVVALDLEEELCDRSSVQSPQEALALAAAIQKTVAFYEARSSHGLLRLPENPLPQNPGGPKGREARHFGYCLRPAPVGDPSDLPMPDRVLPALLGRHTRKWSRPSSLRQRLQGLLTLAQDLSPNSPSAASVRGVMPPAKAGRCSGIYAAFRGFARLGFGILMFVILYAKFYIALTLVPFHR